MTDIQVKVDTVDTIVKYLYNAPKDTVFKAVYGEGHCKGYMLEKMRLLDNLSLFWGELDLDSRDNLVRAAFDYYENRRR
jgi:hypothetical protein